MAEMKTESADGGTPVRRTELNVKKKGRQNMVIIEQSVPEGLPPGWIKEIKIKTVNGRLRKDPYYTDPKTGYVFRSFRDALRYVKTGELGRHAFKPNESFHGEMDPKDDNNRTPAKTTKLQENAIDEKRKDRDSELNEPKKDEKINRYLRSSKRKGLLVDEKVIDNNTSLAVPENKSPEKTVAAKQPKRSKKTLCNESTPSTLGKRVTRSQSRGKKDDDDNREEKREIATDDSKRQAEKDNDDRKNAIGYSKRQGKKDDQNKKNATDDSKSPEKKDDKNRKTATDDSKRQAKKDDEKRKNTTDDSKSRAKKDNENRANAIDDSKSQEKKDDENKPEQKRKNLSDVALPTRGMKRLASTEPELRRSRATVTKPGPTGLDSSRKAETPSGSASISQSIVRTPDIESSRGSRKIETPFRSRQPSDKLAAGRCEGKSAPNPNLSFTNCRKTGMPSVSTPRTNQNALRGPYQTAARRYGEPSAPQNRILESNWRKSELPSVSNMSAIGKSEGLSASGTSVSHKSKQISGNDAISGMPSLEFPLEDIWKDPCIAFAIRTLTAESLDPPPIVTELSQTPTRVNSSSKETPAVLGKNLGFAAFARKDRKADDKPGSSNESKDSDMFKDPCIEFAIKTLTGTMPVGFDPIESRSKLQGFDPIETRPNLQQKPVVIPSLSLQQAPTSRLSQGGQFLQQHNFKT